MKKQFIILFISSTLLSGCMSIAWIGYDKPIQSNFLSVSDDERCMKIGIQNLSAIQWEAIREATGDVYQIFKSEEFRLKVEAQTWLSSCDKENGKSDEISGKEVYKKLMNKIRDYSIYPRNPWAAIAQTQRDTLNFIKNRVAIRPSRIAAWYSPIDTVKSELVNTIAHETTHIIAYEFADAGHGSDDCPDNRLVSYGIGNLVEQIWLSKRKK